MIDSISLDGLTGSGKTAVGTMLAEALGYILIAPDAICGCIIPHLLKSNLPLSDNNQIIDLLTSMQIGIQKDSTFPHRFVKRREVDYMHFYKFADQQGYQITINGNLTDSEYEYCMERLGIDDWWEFHQWSQKNMKQLLSNPRIHSILVDHAQQLAASHGIVMTGTRLCPSLITNTQHKYILTASLRRRNARIVYIGREGGAIWDKGDFIDETRQKDEDDLSRPPHLQFPKDATEIDTENKAVFEIAKMIYSALELKRPINTKYNWQF